MDVAVQLGGFKLDALAWAASVGGHRVRRFIRNRIPKADVVVLWNGRQNDDMVAHVKDHPGQRFLFVEHGWINQAESLQVDHQGVNAYASWAADPLLIKKWVPARVNSGNLLVILQWDDDTQVKDSYLCPQFDGMADFLGFLADSTRDYGMVVRRHPACPTSEAASAIVEACPAMWWDESRTLEEAMGAAAAMVTINSSCGVPAMGRCLPVFAFGRSVYSFVENACYPLWATEDFQSLGTAYCGAIDDLRGGAEALNALSMIAAHARAASKQWWSNAQLPIWMNRALGVIS